MPRFLVIFHFVPLCNHELNANWSIGIADRSNDFVRTAFGMEYPVFGLPEKTIENAQEYQQKDHESDLYNAPVPENSWQRLSIYVQLKRRAVEPQDLLGSNLGLGENTIVILDSMHQGLTQDELTDGALSWCRLMRHADIETPLVGNPVLVAALRLIFDAIARKWSYYILYMHSYVTDLEEHVYSQPADDKYSPTLWGISKRLLRAERLLKFHILLLENVQNELADITGPKTMEPEWLRQNLKEYMRLSSEIEESLKKPITQMIDLVIFLFRQLLR